MITVSSWPDRGNLRDRLGRLSEPLRELHRMVLRRFLEAGSAPTRRWIEQAGNGLGLDASAVDELAAADAVHLVDGIVAVAYPFSGQPTGHRVELDAGPAVDAMCAIDALGLPPMAGRDARIMATDPCDGRPVQVTVHHGVWTWDPVNAVVVVARTRRSAAVTSMACMCPHSNFHASRDSARAYLARRSDLTGEIVGQQTAIDRARDGFSPLLGSPA